MRVNGSGGRREGEAYLESQSDAIDRAAIEIERG
jgi:hypothetical protein